MWSVHLAHGRAEASRAPVRKERQGQAGRGRLRHGTSRTASGRWRSWAPRGHSRCSRSANPAVKRNASEFEKTAVSSFFLRNSFGRLELSARSFPWSRAPTDFGRFREFPAPLRIAQNAIGNAVLGAGHVASQEGEPAGDEWGEGVDGAHQRGAPD